MTAYAVIYEPSADGSWSARTADLPVYAVGDTREEAESEIRSALALYLDHLAQSGQPTPVGLSAVGTVSV
ncbi:MAG: type II toxin-antitoxin system HicB family antitoxin [Actinomycetota bacterium]|nr:type II toxin-antitoxin system HicB family antitoxin [Actinomycetota bacterium]